MSCWHVTVLSLHQNEHKVFSVVAILYLSTECSLNTDIDVRLGFLQCILSIKKKKTILSSFVVHRTYFQCNFD